MGGAWTTVVTLVEGIVVLLQIRVNQSTRTYRNSKVFSGDSVGCPGLSIYVTSINDKKVVMEY